jgi:hypothetical protein
MSLRKSRIHAPAPLAARCWLLAGAVWPLATLAVVGQTNPVALVREVPRFLEATLQPGETVGNEQVLRCFISCGTNRFVFVMPPAVRTRTGCAETLTLESNDGAYLLNLRILGPGPARLDAGGQLARETEWLGQWPEPRRFERFTTTVSGRAAQGLELRLGLPALGERLRRCVWVPCNAGVLEFSLDASSQRASAALQALDTMLLTFRSNERGELEIIPRSDRT